jgi:maltooligosyltrehalose trehalohydrolase
MAIGAEYLGNDICAFRLWAPFRESVEVELQAPVRRSLALQSVGDGYWQSRATEVSPGTRYRYRLDGELMRPDPASHYQPEGVHGPSAVVDHGGFSWSRDDFQAPSLKDWIFYEVHVGTFSPEGTFAAVTGRLDRLVELGVNALELMPVAAFPGERNWGYDGVHPFAVQGSYGGPEGLKRLVDACHLEGIAVVLDVVYNHLGPEGNYLRDFGPYFTGTYNTPWGEAINFDGPYSDEVRRYFLENARHWFSRYRIDALRLDAVHAIYDASAHPFLLELAEAARRWSEELGRPLYLIAESDLNDTRLISDPGLGGFGLHAQWSDDFHHAVHAYLTGERNGYYQDFGRFTDILKAVRDGFVYDWRYSKYRKRRHGSSCRDLPPNRLVVCIQNHDQVGNRMRGERLNALVSLEAYKLAAALLLLGPNLPLLFMGQEYGEQAPFLYFVSHGDPDLVEAVRRGRREEFRGFAWKGEVPDAQDPATFLRSKLDGRIPRPGPRGTRSGIEGGGAKRQRMLLGFHKELVRLRRRVVRSDRAPAVACTPHRPVLLLEYPGTDERFSCLFNFGGNAERLDRDWFLSKTAGGNAAGWKAAKIFDSSLARWLDPQNPRSRAAGGGDTDGSSVKKEDSGIELPACGAVVYAWSRKEES